MVVLCHFRTTKRNLNLAIFNDAPPVHLIIFRVNLDAGSLSMILSFLHLNGQRGRIMAVLHPLSVLACCEAHTAALCHGSGIVGKPKAKQKAAIWLCDAI